MVGFCPLRPPFLQSHFRLCSLRPPRPPMAVKVVSNAEFSSHVLPGLREQPGFTDCQRVPGADNLWIGPMLSARSPTKLSEYGITHLLAANGDSFAKVFSAQLTVYVLDIEDHPDEDILVALDSCVRFIQTALQTGGGVLVFCTAGISRSATVVIAFLMSSRGLSVDAALATLREARKWTNPNAGFMMQLKAFEDKVRFGGKRVAECELCIRRPITKQRDTTHPAFVIIDCDTCDAPMLVMRGHGMGPLSDDVTAEAESRLRAVAAAQFGPGTYWWIDKTQRTIADHRHWHVRSWGAPKL